MAQKNKIRLTPYQAIFYYEWLHNPERSDYNIVIDNTGYGDFDLDRANKGLAKLLNEHFILNSVVVNEGGELYWKIKEPVVTPIKYFPEPLSEKEMYDLVSTPFNLEDDDLLKMYIINLGDKKFRIIIVVSHIIVDGISTEEVRKKWSQQYNNEPYDKELESINRQIELHNELNSFFEQNLEKNKEKIHGFWKNRLKDISGVELNFLKSSKATSSNDLPKQRYLTESCFSYTGDIYTNAKNLKYDYKITPYIFGQLVLAVLLHKISGKDKLALAYPIAVLEGQELIYGAHVNTMIIDYRFDENKTLNSLIEAALDFYKGLKVSKAKYLPVYEISKYADNAGVLHIGFAQTFFRDYGLGFNGIQDVSVNHEFQIDLVNDFLFEQEDHNNSLNYRVRYYADFLDNDLVAQFLKLYQKLFVELLDDLVNKRGDRLIEDIRLLTDGEKNFLIEEWNSQKDLTKLNKTVVELIEERAKNTPDNIAVVFKDKQFSYKELNQKTNSYASYLKSTFNIQSNDLVALYLDKSELMPIAILSILKARGAYVPMDPGAPDDRILYMLEDTKAKAIITTSAHKDKLKTILQGQSVEVLDISDEQELQRIYDNYPSHNLFRKATGSDLAYVIYTSGTTGKPKGVMLEHSGLASLALVQGEAFGLKNEFENGVQKRCLWYASYIFDAHVSEVFTALANGHSLHILEDDKRLDYKLLSEYISENKIDVATIPPVLLDKNRLLELSTLIVAGEVTNMEVMDNYRNKGVKLINAYGPTEGTVCSSLHFYEIGDKNTNIGRPLCNMTSYVLDAAMQPLPIGAVGELYIGGAGIARGYVNNPDLTADRFIVNPFQLEKDRKDGYNGRLYKTGDLVRLLPNGDIEYIGRNDFQVKIRGFRIELGEIETRLAEFDNVDQAVVLAKENTVGGKYLVGYYVSQNELKSDSIKEYLNKYLPEYMVPTAFVHLTSLPMTVNGKVDRRALPEPELTDKRNYVSPKNDMEKALCKIYGQVLGIPENEVSADDDFFKIGGDSISSIQLVGRIRQQMQLQVDMKDIFNCRTVSALAAKLTISGMKIVQIKNEQGLLVGETKLLPIQNWFFHNLDQGTFRSYNHWNQTFMLDVPVLNEDILRKSLSKLVEYHDALRLTYARDVDGTYTQYYKKQLNSFSFDVVDASAMSEEEIKNTVDRWQQGFDVFSSPLFHIGYLNYGDSAKLHFAFHHLVVDAISWHIIKNDLQTIYKYLEKNIHLDLSSIDIQAVLGAKKTSYRQWTETVYLYKASAKEVAYWEKLSENVTLTNRLFRGLEKNFSFKYNSVMDAAYTGKMLKNIHHVYGTQINDILLTAFGATLKGLTGSDVHSVTMEGHGRENISDSVDISNTVGWFTSMYPVEIKSGFSNLGDRISAVKDMLNTVPNKGLGYGAMFGYTKKELPRIGFNYLGQFDNNASGEGWTFSSGYTGQAVAADNKNMNILSIDCGVIDNEFRIQACGWLDKEVLSSFTENFIKQLKNIIDILSAKDRTYLTLSDIDAIISYDHLSATQAEKEIEGIYLANSLQQGFVYHAISQGNVDDAYRTQMLWDYHNSLNIEVLKQAWVLTQQKYPSLRLRFAWDEEIVQIIDKQGTLDWNYIDLSDMNPEDQDIFVEDLLETDRQTEYDLQKGSLFRVYIIKRNDQFYNCIFSNHHAILDGWSNPILIKYVHDIYLSLLHQQPITKEVDLVYGLSQKYLQSNKAENVSFWSEYLKKQVSSEDLTNLLAPDKKNINLSEYKLIKEWDSKTLAISGNDYAGIKQLVSSNGITVNALLQYCWHKQLGIYTAADTTIVGMVVAGRSLPIENIEQSVGLYINTLPMICLHDKNLSVMDQVKALQDDINEGNHRCNIDLSQLQTEGNRLFNSLFVFENYPMPEGVLGEELSISFKGAREKQDYPLVVTVFEQNGQLLLNLQYAKELFEGFIIEQMIDGMSYLLNQLVNKEDIKACELSYINTSDYVKIIEKWNDNQVSYHADKTVTALFEEQVQKNPDKIAVRYENVDLTYSELNRKANQLAIYLKQKYTIRPDDLIALYLDRSEHILISILAVLKTGAAYLPIDSTMPDDRVSYMLSDAKVVCVLANECYKDRLLSLEYQTFVEAVDSEWLLTQLNTLSPENPEIKIKPENLIYVMYTSGTTGLPKGVMIEHRHINSLIYNSNYVSIDSNDNLLSLAGYQFDGSTYDFYAALLNGASVVISTKDVFLNLNEFNSILEKYDITNFFVTTALFNMLVDAELPNLKRLKYILFGGELVSTYHVNKFNQLYSNVKLIHMYGPTETTTYATAYLTNAHEGDFTNNVPIGFPLQNTTLYVVDENMNPVPVGALGELYIGGAGVARGYLNNETLTNERFIENPFQTETEKAVGYNQRIYKSGDIVRYIPEGSIEYIGRNDFQVKIRGFRIELGEIEARMTQYEGVKQSVVVAYEHSGVKSLAGYYVSEKQYDVEAFRNYLAETLPDYMIPSALIHLEALPLNINGKVDRRALPKPQLTNESKYVAPKGETEERLCRLYASTLSLEACKISVEDDFFRLGGNSILAIKLASRISKAFELDLHISSIFTYKTIRALATYLEVGDSPQIKVAAEPVSSVEEQLLSFAQERLWFIESYEEGSNAYNIPMVFRLKEDTDVQLMYNAIESIVERHEVLRTLILSDNEGKAFQVVCALEEKPLPMVVNTFDDIAEMEQHMSDVVNRVFHLTDEYPIHISVYYCNGQSFMSIVVHHIAFDGWSTDLMIKEIYSYYHYHLLCSQNQNEQAQKFLLPAPEVQYKEFALWQRNYLQGEVLDKQLKFWKEHLEGYETLSIPTDKVRPSQIDYRGHDIMFSIDPETSNRLRELAKELNVSLYSLCLSGYYLLLSAFSNQKDIVVGTPIAGRNYQEIQDTMGFFVNMLALRSQIDKTRSIEDYITSTGLLINEAQLYQDLPFEKLVDVLHAEKDSSRHPIFQVIFGMQSFGSKKSEIEQLVIPYTMQTVDSYEVAKYDFTVMLDDSEESISGMFNYATSLFDEATVNCYIEVYKHILTQLTLSNKERRISEVTYLNESHYQKLIIDWNDTRSSYPKDKTLIQMFEEQVERTPNNIALVYENVRFTYHELNERVNRLGAYLKSTFDIQTDDLIGICLERSEHMLISILAILKSGAAYVTMDPSAPEDRLVYMVEDTKTKVVLVNKHKQPEYKTLFKSSEAIAVDDEVLLNKIERTYTGANFVITNTSQSLVYIIYTSGTTGNPKGVAVRNQGVINFVTSMCERIGIYVCEKDSVPMNNLWYSNYIFDAHVLELYASVLCGHTLHILSQERRYDLALINEYIRQNNIEFSYIAPAILNKDYLLDLKTILVGGEATNLEVMNFYRSNGVKIYNAYGPTETSVGATIKLFEQGDNNTNIGKGLANTTLYILNENLQPLPLGAVGELYIGGDGVAIGYLNNSQLTQERFLSNPFQTQEEKYLNLNSRIYKTGDLVRYLPNGELMFLGRNDFQVKIRGYRIELGEIESRLAEIQGIKQAVVLALNNKATGSKYLVGYYVSENKLDTDIIQDHLSKSLPAYMVPPVFVHLESLPMTANGKLNRRALPVPVVTSEKEDYIAPATEIEKTLCRIFAEVLNLEESVIGIGDDFFRLGGDSISSIQLVNRLRKNLNVQLSVKDVFKYSVIRSLSDYITNHCSANIVQVLTESGNLKGDLKLLPIQEWFFDNVDKNIFTRCNHWNQSFLLEVPTLNKNVLEISLKKLVEYHDGFRLCFRKELGEYIQYYKEEIENLPYDYVYVNGHSSEQIEELLTNWQSEFDILGKNLFHIGYLEGYPDGTARLHFALHHLIVDAVSWRIIQNDISAIYQYVSNNPDTSLETPAEDILGKKGSSYRQWIEKIADYKQPGTEKYTQEIKFWKDVTDGIDQENTLLDRLKTESVAKGKLVLDEKVTDSLLRDIHSVYNTQINDVLLTALAFALKDLTAQSTHHILLEGHGREDLFADIDINNTIGWFTTMYPVKLTTEDYEIKQALPLIKDGLRRIPNNGIGYGALIGYTKQSLPSISFNYLGQFDVNKSNDSWSFSVENPGNAIGEGNDINKFMSINGGIIEGKLQLAVECFLSLEQTGVFIKSFKQHLENLVASLVDKKRTYLTPSDTNYIVSDSYLEKLQNEREIEGVYMANSLQQGFIYHAISQKEDDAYIIQAQWDYHTAIDVDKLKEAWKYTQAKYPALRLRFSWEEELIQIIDKESELNWIYSDITNLSEEKQNDILKKMLDKDRNILFDLERGNLFRVYVVKRAENWYSCILSNHHAISDGWSGPLLIGYIHKTYVDLLKQRPISQDVDSCYAEAQKYLQENKEENIRFWKNYLQMIETHEDMSALLKPSKRGVNLSEYKTVKESCEMSVSISGIVYEQLKNICAGYGFTLNALLQYCWHKQLNVYGGTDTTVIGMTVAGRSLPVEGIEESVGLYINTLPVILEHTDAKIVDQIKTLQGYINDINSKSDVSLAQLHEAGTRLFNSLFVFENYPLPEESEDADYIKLELKYSKEKLDYPLGVSAYEKGNEAVFKIQYAGELFDQDVINQLLNGVTTILEQLAVDPEMEVRDMQLLDSDKFKQIVHQWNDTYVEFEQEKTIVQVFEEQAERTPDNIAVFFKGKTLTYKELNEKANMLGAYLKESFGILPDDKIALFLDKSELLPVVILGVMKSGGAYVPISPDAPIERVQYMVNDINAKVVLTSEARFDQIQSFLEDKQTDILAIDNSELLQNITAICSSANPRLNTTSRNLAYIIYTSGTTGQPKGVMLEHRGLVNMVTMQTRSLDLYTCNKDSRQKNCLWYASYVFDAHVFEFFNVIANGHCVCILEEENRLSFDALKKYIQNNDVELAAIPPALLDKDDLLALSTVVVAGEVTSLEAMNNYRKAGVKVNNAYGPTEDTVWSTSHYFELGDTNTNIGRPLANVAIYILDKNLKPVPVGAIGELYIGGAGVARGYLNNEILTNERFIVNPFQTDAEKNIGYNDRIYKSGDLARFHHDGFIEYVGRNDFQVKIRGFRIELGEIEARMIQYEGVKQAVVLAYEHSGVKSLVGYYVSEEPIDNAMLENHLAESLPDYMIPSVFIHLLELPLTINRKIDRKALPKPELTNELTYAAPQTETEKRLCELYASILSVDVDKMSVEEDFFRLGGNSILAIKLASRINKAFEVDMHISSIFTYKTIRLLATYLDSGNMEQVRISAESVSTPEEQLLSFAQERLWFIESYEEGSNAYNIPMVFRLNDKVEIRLMYRALESIVERHEVLRSLIKTNKEGIGYQVVCSLEEKPLPMAINSYRNVAEMESAISNTISRVFRLGEEFPIHIAVYECNEMCCMSIVVHHIAFDGWSTDLMIKELYSYYHYHLLSSKSQEEQARSYELPLPAVQYKDFALWQRNFLKGSELEKQLGFWKGQLEGYETLNLPTDKVRPAHIDYRGHDIKFSLDAETSNRLRGLAKDLNVSLYSLFLSGYYLLLSAFSNQNDIVVGTPIAGRNYLEIQDTMGFFVNMLALRSQIEKTQSVKDFIAQTGTLINNAQLYQDLPFEKLVDALNVEKDSSRHPIFQVIFSMQSFGAGLSKIDDLIKPYQMTTVPEFEVAKYDMTVMFDDAAENIGGVFNYAMSLFDESTMMRYIEVYKHILTQFAAKGKDLKLSDITYLDEKDYQKVILDWNKTESPYPKDKTVIQMFEDQVERTPDNIALVYEDVRLTYRELNERANRLGAYLRTVYDIRPDDLIALCQRRSEHMLISVLAVLKSGAAYVPMDPSAPEDRIEYMVGDTKAKVVLTNKYKQAELSQLLSTSVIAVDDQDLMDRVALYTNQNFKTATTPKNLAYIIYTSGTTGNPKGAMIEHQSVINRIKWMHEEYPITENDRILQKTTYTFDVSVWELFWANWYGACIVLADHDNFKDNVYLSQLIEKEKATVMHFVPSMLIAFVEGLEADPQLQRCVQGMKYLFCSGEALNLYEVRKFRNLIPNCELHNLYGPTEATVDVLYYDCNDRNLPKVLIGKPISNTSAYVLNSDMKPLPIGAVGELFVGGDGVGRGYLNNSQLTQERFLANPFQTQQEKELGYNDRIYKTGDLVVYQKDGNIEYIGRNDFQVKIRGFRIELGEIETRMSEVENIRQAVVLALTHSSGSKMLVGYYVSDTEIDDSIIRNHLLQNLPEYMVPSVFVHLLNLPVNKNGKLDRKALPEPQLSNQETYVAPETETEHALTDIISDILALEAIQIGVEDDFFKLGGNSILAMKLSYKINEELSVKIRLIDILEAKKIRRLAAIIDKQKQGFNPIAKLNHAPDKKVLFMVHPGMGGCDVYAPLAQKFASYFQCYGIDSYNFYHDEKISNLSDLSDYYLSHILKTNVNQNEYNLFGWSFGGQIALEIAAKLEKMGKKDITVYLLDTWVLEEEFLKAGEPNIDEVMDRFNIPYSEKNKVMDIAKVESEISAQPLSDKLKHTKIVLFKAMENNGHEMFLKYPKNNIDKQAESDNQLKVIEVDCAHYDIIKHDQLILEYIVSANQLH